MNNNDLFEKVPISKAYFKLALPVVLSMVISLVYNMVDTFFVAQTQNTNLVAGVSLCAPIFTLILVYLDKNKMKKERTSVVFVSMELLFVVS